MNCYYCKETIDIEDKHYNLYYVKVHKNTSICCSCFDKHVGINEDKFVSPIQTTCQICGTEVCDEDDMRDFDPKFYVFFALELSGNYRKVFVFCNDCFFKYVGIKL